MNESNTSKSTPANEAVVPLAPPQWAARSVREEGGVTHEMVSDHHPAVSWQAENGWGLLPADVSLSLTDRWVESRWVRGAPTIQIEGGSYRLDAVRELRTALDEFLDCAIREVGSGDGGRRESAAPGLAS